MEKTAAAPVRFAILVGSPESEEAVFDRAVSELTARFRLWAASPPVRGASVIAGDPVRYVNQVLILAGADASRDVLRDQLKAIERQLGRVPGQQPPVVDLDLLAEYGPEGDALWRDEGKLAHAPFRELLAQGQAAAPVT